MIQEKRILAIDPSTRGFGFVVMEGPESLIDWGVKGTRKNKNEHCLHMVAVLIDRYLPDVVVVEDFAARGSRRCQRVQELICRIQKLASEKGIKIREVSPAEVKRTFAETNAATKHQISSAIAARLPALVPRLPPYRKPWMCEDYRMSIFDAASFALTFFHLEK